MPAHGGELTAHLPVPFLVPLHLIDPERRVSLRHRVTFAALVPVPETAVDEDTRPVLPHHDVRFPRKTRMIQTIAEAMPPQPFPHHHLRLGILAVDGSHIGVALGWSKGVGHKVLLFTWVHKFNESGKTIEKWGEEMKTLDDCGRK